jgi:hypothetical protein
MCDCIKEIEKKLHENCLKHKYRKPFEKVKIEQRFVINKKDGSLGQRMFTKALITLNGQNKKLEEIILHSYCPFCGEEI